MFVELFILRHGEAGQRIIYNKADHERSLTVSGKEEVEIIARSLKILGITFDLILSSPLKRAYETAAIVAKILKVKDMQILDELSPEEDKKKLYQKLENFEQHNGVLIVGHEPKLSEVISELINQQTGINHIRLKKAGIAYIRITSVRPLMKGELLWLLTPKILKMIYKKSKIPKH